METYSKTYEIRWSDLDANGHVRYSAYIDTAADLRYHFFAEHGFPPETFQKLGLGLIYTSLSAQFLREIRPGEILTINYLLAGLSPRGTRWKVQHNFFKANGKKAAVIALEGAILDLNTRRATQPPAELWDVIQHLPRAKVFEEMSESRWLKAGQARPRQSY